jgi:uncharacterized protein YaiI (UPF0178 family)
VKIYVDADACPVKEQIYRVGARYEVPVLLVANAPLRLPPTGDVQLVHVPGSFEVVDDWIAEHAVPGDIVTTADVHLAGRVVDRGAACLDFRGKEFTADAIGGLLASREVAQYLRGFGQYGGGPPPFSARDRGRFASALDTLVNRLRRQAGPAGDPGAPRPE